MNVGYKKKGNLEGSVKLVEKKQGKLENQHHIPLQHKDRYIVIKKKTTIK